MNQIGNRIIKYDDRVSVDIKNNFVTIKGPKGVLNRQFNHIIKITNKSNCLTTVTSLNTTFARALLGTTNSHIYNMVIGVTEGYKRQLMIVGVGYRAALRDDKITLSLGYSHPVVLTIPKGVEINVIRNTTVTVSGIDKEKVTAFAALIKSQKKPEPYLGKGIKYEGERIIRKAGKTAGK